MKDEDLVLIKVPILGSDQGNYLILKDNNEKNMLIFALESQFHCRKYGFSGIIHCPQQLRVDPSQPSCLRHSSNAQHQGSRSHIHFFLLGSVQNFGKTFFQNAG